MARPRRKKVTEQINIEDIPRDEQLSKELVKQMVAKPAEVNIEDMPLTTLGEYMRYNRKARELNKKLKINRYPIKQCPVELHPMERIIFGRVDQPTNPCPVYLSNDMIHYDRTKLKDQLMPGKTYDLPRCVVEHLSKKGTPVWKWFENADGSRETRKETVIPRFSLRTVYQD